MATDMERILGACEAALSRPGKSDLRALGFWKAVSAAKRDPKVAAQYARRIGNIDRDAFLRATPFAFPISVGIALEAAATAATLIALAIAPRLPVLGSELVYIGGTAVLIASLHSLTHWVVGRAMGMRFTHAFSQPPLKPQPGFKLDYATYLRVPARSRAWMHASGAITSKVVPFAVAAWAAANNAPGWCLLVLLAIGVGQLITDATLSTRLSDWKRFRREMRFAR